MRPVELAEDTSQLLTLIINYLSYFPEYKFCFYQLKHAVNYGAFKSTWEVCIYGF